MAALCGAAAGCDGAACGACGACGQHFWMSLNLKFIPLNDYGNRSTTVKRKKKLLFYRNLFRKEKAILHSKIS